MINVTQTDPPQSEEDPPPDDQVKCYRLGLYRLGDISDPDKKQDNWSWPVLRNHLHNAMPANTSTIGFGLLFVIIVVGLPVLAILFFQHLKGKSVGDESGFTKSIAVTDEHRKKVLRWEKLSSGNQSGASSIINLGESAASLERLANYTEELSHIIQGNPGASVFVVPEIMQQLNITDQQQHKLNALVDATSDLIYDLENQLKGAISSEQYQKLFDLTRNNALQLLTDKQRLKWQILSGNDRQDKSHTEANVDK